MTKKKVYTYRGVSFKVPDAFGDPNTVEYYKPTLKQIKNLIDMAAVIQNSPPPAFDMSTYAVLDSLYENDARYPKIVLDNVDGCRNVSLPAAVKSLKEVNVCGTSCCAIGTAAYHGVGKLTRHMDWETYSFETFGLTTFSNPWSFLFSMEWADVDNTPEGAVARILKLVIEGPENIMAKFSNYVSLMITHDDGSTQATRDIYKDYLGVAVEHING
jgi:hypothetical protein